MFDLKCNYVKLHQERSVVRIMKGVRQWPYSNF